MSTKSLLFTIGFALCVFVALTFFAVSPASQGVTLQAKSWNAGKVHLWQTLVESEATFVDMPEGTRCERVDNKTHRLIGPPPPIFYYRVNCGGVMGFVEIDQVR